MYSIYFATTCKSLYHLMLGNLTKFNQICSLISYLLSFFNFLGVSPKPKSYTCTCTVQYMFSEPLGARYMLASCSRPSFGLDRSPNRSSWWGPPIVAVTIVQEELLVGRDMAFAHNVDSTIDVKLASHNICFETSLMINILNLAIHSPAIDETTRGGKHIGGIIGRVVRIDGNSLIFAKYPLALDGTPSKQAHASVFSQGRRAYAQ